MTLALTLLLCVLQYADFYTTTRILNNGGKELNPVMAYLFGKLGMKPALILKGMLVVVTSYLAGVWVLAFSCVVYTGLIIFNWWSMPK